MGSLNVNGGQCEFTDGSRNLLSYLRFDLGLTGTKYGCGEGLCGACTVLVDGRAMKSCMTTVGSVAGGNITTIEGMAKGSQLHPLQEAFVEETAFQCGYCTPGFIMAAAGMLQRETCPNRDQIREGLMDNICRCGAYQRIEQAVERAAAVMQEQKQ